MKSIFISYAHADGSEVAELLYQRLTWAGFQVWKDDRSLPLGAPFAEEISKAVGAYDNVLLIVSSAAIQSHWVQFEANLAETARRRLIPILIEPIEPERLPLYLRMRAYLMMENSDWRALHKLVDHLEDQKIARLVNLSGRTDFQVTNGLLLGNAPFRFPDLISPDELIAYGIELARFALPYLREVHAGVIPPGHAPVACVTLAYLLGELNSLPRLFVTHQNAHGLFQVDGSRPLALQDVRNQGFRDRSNR